MEGSARDTTSAVDRERPPGFDTSSYERLLRRLMDQGRQFVGFDERGRDGSVLLQHDVELSLNRAVTMARLEATLRVEGTYCFPLDAPIPDASVVRFDRTVRTVSRLGHDVGLQFDPLAHWDDRPSETALRAKIDRERETLGRLLGEDVEVVSFRRTPEWTRDVELSDALDVCRAPPEACIVDREWRDEEPSIEDAPERFRLLIHPGLWYPVERSETAVLDAGRRAAHDRVDVYFEMLDSRARHSKGETSPQSSDVCYQ